ncbi:hypothetical protein EDD85DRAFT_783103 [Armillaria nabsnona]|nr:hypothetical protein EDD85DRAFT_783103 [Armillaria nabsnona]
MLARSIGIKSEVNICFKVAAHMDLPWTVFGRERIAKAKGEDGEEITPAAEFSNGIVNHLKPIRFSLVPRTTKAASLILFPSCKRVFLPHMTRSTAQDISHCKKRWYCCPVRRKESRNIENSLRPSMMSVSSFKYIPYGMPDLGDWLESGRDRAIVKEWLMKGDHNATGYDQETYVIFERSTTRTPAEILAETMEGGRKRRLDTAKGIHANVVAHAPAWHP